MKVTGKIITVLALCTGFVQFSVSVKQPVYAYKAAGTDKKAVWTVMVVDSDTNKEISRTKFKSNSGGLSPKGLYFDFDTYPNEKIIVCPIDVKSIKKELLSAEKWLKENEPSLTRAQSQDSKSVGLQEPGYLTQYIGLGEMEGKVKEKKETIENLTKQVQQCRPDVLSITAEVITKEKAKPGAKIEITQEGDTIKIAIKEPGAVRAARKNVAQKVRKAGEKVKKQVEKAEDWLNKTSL